MKANPLTLIACGLYFFSYSQKFETQSISIFKNGTVFFHKKGLLDASTGSVKIAESPLGEEEENALPYKQDEELPILFGSVWFASSENPLLRTTVYEESIEKEVKHTSLLGIIRNNIGKTLNFKLKEESERFSGEIIALHKNEVLVRLEDYWKRVNLNQIDLFDIPDSPNLTWTKSTSVDVIQLDFEKKQAKVPVDLMYMQKGISWVPNYYFEILDENKARLSLKANLLNDIEDLTGVDVNFVLGIPSFSFAHIQDPIFSNQEVSGFLAQINSQSGSSPRFRGGITTQRAFVNQAFTIDMEESTEESTSNLGTEDLFFYKQKKITLPEGGRMLVHLLDTEINYEDVYSVQLRSKFHGDNRTESFRNKVWHSLKFKNESGFPLTTGSISFVKKENGVPSPVSQNQLDFVPTGLHAKVKMSQVPDISVLDQEKEISRQDRVRQNWDMVTVEATIEISNFKNKTIAIEVEREIIGELIASDYPWEAYSITENLNAFNQKNKVNWKLQMEPGAKKKITYQYKVLVH